VLFWNEQALNATRLARNPPPIASAFYATYHVAIFDTVNGHHAHATEAGSITSRLPPAPTWDAAIARRELHGAQCPLGPGRPTRAIFQLAYDRALVAIADGPGKASGIAWGQTGRAALVLAERAKERFRQANSRPVCEQTNRAKWRETPPGFRTVCPAALEKGHAFL